MSTDAAPASNPVADDAFKANFARNLRRLREAAGLNRAQFARLVDVDKMRITRLESGDHAPGGALLLRIAAALNTTAEALASESQPSESQPAESQAAEPVEPAPAATLPAETKAAKKRGR